MPNEKFQEFLEEKNIFWMDDFPLVNTMILKLKYGEVEIELYPEKAPNHVKRFKEKLEHDGR